MCYTTLYYKFEVYHIIPYHVLLWTTNELRGTRSRLGIRVVALGSLCRGTPTGFPLYFSHFQTNLKIVLAVSRPTKLMIIMGNTGAPPDGDTHVVAFPQTPIFRAPQRCTRRGVHCADNVVQLLSTSNQCASIYVYVLSSQNGLMRTSVCVALRQPCVRPVRLSRVWISEGLTQANS